MVRRLRALPGQKSRPIAVSRPAALPRLRATIAITSSRVLGGIGWYLDHRMQNRVKRILCEAP